jgi:hypothetical protein
MSFEFLGEGLRLFEGWALRVLANFRKRYRDNLVSGFKSFLYIEESRFNIWTSCAYYTFLEISCTVYDIRNWYLLRAMNITG